MAGQANAELVVDLRLLRAAVEASGEAILITSAELDEPGPRIEYANPAFTRMTGYEAYEIIGCSPRFLQGPGTERAVLDRLRRDLEAGEASQGEAVNYRKNGSTYMVEWLITPVREADGRVTHWVSTQRDITERKRVEETLTASEGRLRTLMEGIPQLVWRSSSQGQWSWSNPQWQTFTGQSQEQSHGLGWQEAVHPDDRESTMQAWEVARVNGMLDVEYRVRRASDGAYLWHHTRSLPVRDATGCIVEWLGTTTDVQQKRELQERQEVLVNELQHRSRNLLAVVNALANRTIGQGAPVESFTSRVKALGRAQGLLSQSGSDTVEVGALVHAELAAHADNTLTQITISGPEVQLSSQQVQNFALALHELATNAVKYGALKCEAGRLSVTWERMRDEAGTKRLALSWIESGVDVPPENLSRRGYGRELIERALTYALQARTEFELAAGGVRCRIEMPLA